MAASKSRKTPAAFPGMKGKVAVITGAERGIGRGLAIGFAQAGVRLVLNYFHSKKEADETVRLVAAEGSVAISVKGDIALPATAKKLIAAAYFQFGALDAIVNNAGVHLYQPLAEVTEANWDRQLSANLKGPFLLAQAAVAAWRRDRTPGRIVNITSRGAEMPFQCSAAYNASKAGLLGLTKQLALELAPDRICVNAVAPGVVHTSINDALLRDPESRAAWESVVPAGRIAVPADVVGAVLFLCSDMSSYITGQHVTVDGAWGLNLAWGVKP